MALTQQTFVNRKEAPIYVSVEIWPECFELEPGDKLTLVWEAPSSGDAAEIEFINDRELVVFPNGDIDGMQFMINGEAARHRSWSFKHK
jgi:hypothetical protein